MPTVPKRGHNSGLVRSASSSANTHGMRRGRTQLSIGEPVDVAAENDDLRIDVDVGCHLLRDYLAIPGQDLHRDTVIGQFVYSRGGAFTDRVNKTHETGQHEVPLIGFCVPLNPAGQPLHRNGQHPHAPLAVSQNQVVNLRSKVIAQGDILATKACAGCRAQ